MNTDGIMNKKVAIYYPHQDSAGFSLMNLLSLMHVLNEFFLSSFQLRVFQPESAADPEIEKFRKLQTDCDTVILVMNGNDATYELGSLRRGTEYDGKTKILFAITDPFMKLPPENFGLGGDQFFVFEWYRCKDDLEELEREARNFLFEHIHMLPVFQY